MDDFALQQELEALAGNASNPALDVEGTKPEPISHTIKRWQKLFDLSEDEALDRLQDHRRNLTRTRVSDAHWETVREEKESQGYDCEAYEYELELQRKRAFLSDSIPAGDEKVTYLVEMSGPLDTPEKVRRAANVSELPGVVEGRSVEEDRQVSLCCIDGAAKAAILHWAAEQKGGFEPVILVNPRSLR